MAQQTLLGHPPWPGGNGEQRCHRPAVHRYRDLFASLNSAQDRPGVVAELPRCDQRHDTTVACVLRSSLLPYSGCMPLIFERGSEQRPKGHALIYFRDENGPGALATYLV